MTLTLWSGDKPPWESKAVLGLAAFLILSAYSMFFHDSSQTMEAAKLVAEGLFAFGIRDAMN